MSGEEQARKRRSLRSLLATTSERVVGVPSLTKYAAALRKAGVLTANEEKDVIAIAGTRTDAAHGHFDLISIERAKLMADKVNYFIARKHRLTESRSPRRGHGLSSGHN